MSSAFSRIKYTGSTPGADANTYVMFSTVAAGFGGNLCAECGIHKFLLKLLANAAATINVYKSQDRGVTWKQVATAAHAGSATVEATYEYVVETYADFKVELVNGGAAQTTWFPDMALIDQRAAS